MVFGKEKARSLRFEQLESRRLFAINPTGEEQELLQLINRFRTDPGGEFNRLFSSAAPLTARDSSMQVELDFFKVDANMLRNEWAALSPVKPVTWNEAIINFSANHNNSMIAQNQLFHTDPLARRATLIAAGVNLDVTSGQRVNSEIVFGPVRSPIQNYAAYAVNWGTGSGGMEQARSHREALMNAVFEEIGGKLTDTTASNLKPRVNTFVLANIANAAVRVSGAVFEDKNGSGWYESGEGVGSVNLRFEHVDGRVFNTTAFSAGGYHIEVPAGTYKVRVTGGTLQHALIRTITVSDKSLWENFVYKVGDPAPDVNEPNDILATATTLTAPSSTQSGLSLHSSSDVDVFKYTAVGTGPANYELLFSNASGNIDLQLLNASGQVLASSITTGNGEAIQFQAIAGTTYFLRVFGAANSNYSIRVTGPEAIAADSNEPNDSIGTATALNGSSPSLNNLNLHTNFDVDLYRYDAVANGQATFRTSFDNNQGNIDLQLLDSAGSVLQTAATSGSGETITASVERGKSYYVKVYGGPNKLYSLSISGPTLRAPIAVRDQAVMTSEATSAVILILANDSDPDGSVADLVPSFTTNPSSFVMNSDKTVTVRATTGFTGVLRANYQLTDIDGLKSSPVSIDVMVVDYSRSRPWQNPDLFKDVNDDNSVTPSDALLVINYLNSGGARLLPVSGPTNLFGFLDVRADGIVSPTDALQIINQLNSSSAGEGESDEQLEYDSRDLAFAQMAFAYDSLSTQEFLRSRRFR